MVTPICLMCALSSGITKHLRSSTLQQNVTSLVSYEVFVQFSSRRLKTKIYRLHTLIHQWLNKVCLTKDILPSMYKIYITTLQEQDKF